MDNRKPTDECITRRSIMKIHHRIGRTGTKPSLNALAERESSLAAYVLFCGHAMATTAKEMGAPRGFIEWLEQEIVARLLVCIEAQHSAHFELWRDLMGDEPEPTEQKGEDHVG